MKQRSGTTVVFKHYIHRVEVLTSANSRGLARCAIFWYGYDANGNYGERGMMRRERPEKLSRRYPSAVIVVGGNNE